MGLLMIIIILPLTLGYNAYASCDGYVYLVPENKFMYTNSSVNTSTTEGGSNCYQVKSAVQNILTGIRMNQAEQASLDAHIAEQQHQEEQLSGKYILPTLNQSNALQEIKTYAANYQRMELEQNRADYLASTTETQTSVIKMEMQMLHQQRVNINQINESQALNPWTSNWSMNPMQNFTDNVNHPTPIHMPQLKPEYYLHPSGWVNQTVIVSNWADLQKWMTQNNTK